MSDTEVICNSNQQCTKCPKQAAFYFYASVIICITLWSFHVEYRIRELKNMLRQSQSVQQLLTTTPESEQYELPETESRAKLNNFSQR